MIRAAILLLVIALFGFIFFKAYENKKPMSIVLPINTPIVNSPTPSPTPTHPPIPTAKMIENDYQVFQTFNNCGPAALSMALSYYGINETQQVLGQDLRPYQNPAGDNDDKSVTLDELAQKAQEYNLIPYHRPNGSPDLIKQFVAQGLPVITRTHLTDEDDIGHYRVIKGYDDASGEFIQDDSLQGHNLRYSYSSFMRLWKIFTYEYLVLVPYEKKQIAENLLGENTDEKIAWKNAALSIQKELEENPDDIYARFNLSIALYHVGDFQGSVDAFEAVEKELPFRTMWYQIEPILSYYELGEYGRVFNITDNIFNRQNRAFSELYILRAKIYQKQGNTEKADAEIEKAVFYNKNIKI